MTKRDAETRERIIGAAQALIGEQGDAAGVTTRDIAARAGVGVGLVNYHFQTKDNLVDICVQRIIGNVIERFRPLYEGLDMKPVDKLRFLVRRNFQFLIQNPAISRTSILHDMVSAGAGDNTSQTLEAYRPVIREVCGGRATEAEQAVLLHALISLGQACLLRGEVFQGFTGFDVSDEGQLGQFVDILIDSLFHKYL